MSPDMVEAFSAAFDAGLAHSVEIWDRSGALAGGIFGLAIGGVFFTEGNFAKARDASKVGFTAPSVDASDLVSVATDVTGEP